MPPVTRIGDNNTGHDACPPVPLSAGSPDVFANGIAVCRIGDPAGSSTVFVNGIPVSRIGDAVDCGGAAAAGSPDVIIGG